MNAWIVTAQDAPASAMARGLEQAGWSCTRFEDAEAMAQLAASEPPDAFLVLEPCPPWGAAGLLSRLGPRTTMRSRPV